MANTYTQFYVHRLSLPLRQGEKCDRMVLIGPVLLLNVGVTASGDWLPRCHPGRKKFTVNLPGLKSYK